MSIARGRYEGQTQSGGVNDAIALDFGPAKPDNETISRRGAWVFFLSLIWLYSTSRSVSFLFYFFSHPELIQRTASIAFFWLGLDGPVCMAGTGSKVVCVLVL